MLVCCCGGVVLLLMLLCFVLGRVGLACVCVSFGLSCFVVCALWCCVVCVSVLPICLCSVYVLWLCMCSSDLSLRGRVCAVVVLYCLLWLVRVRCWCVSLVFVVAVCLLR